MSADLISTRRSEALFASDLQPSDCPTVAAVSEAIARSLRNHHGIRGCIDDMAAEYGRDPIRAAARMCWAIDMVTAAEAARPARRRTPVADESDRMRSKLVTTSEH